MDKVHTTKGGQQTQAIAREFAESLMGGEVVALTGDLGAGKTTFTQGLAKALGVSRNVNSPTFIIHRSYKISSKHKVASIKNLHHIDLYRISDSSDVIGLGLEAIFKDKDAITVVEWPEKMGNLLPKKRIDIKFEYIGENERRITIQNPKF